MCLRFCTANICKYEIPTGLRLWNTILWRFYLAGRQNASSSTRGPREDVCFDLFIVLKHICCCLLPVCNPTDTGSYIMSLFTFRLYTPHIASRALQHNQTQTLEWLNLPFTLLLCLVQDWFISEVCVCVCRSQGEVRIGLLTVSTDSSANRASLRGDLIRAGGCTSGRPHNKWPTVPRTPVAYEIKRTFITLSVIPLCPRSPFLSQSASSGGRRGSHHYLWCSESKTCSRTNSHTEVLCPAVFFPHMDRGAYHNEEAV